MDIYSNDFANIAFNLNPLIVWKAYQFQSKDPLTLKDVARAIGLNYCYLSRVINGKAAISLDRFESFYRYLYLNLQFQNLA